MKACTVVCGVQAYSRILGMKPFVIVGDHKALLQIFNLSYDCKNKKLLRFTLYLQGYTFIYDYVAGTSLAMLLEDYMSRLGLPHRSDNLDGEQGIQVPVAKAQSEIDAMDRHIANVYSGSVVKKLNVANLESDEVMSDDFRKFMLEDVGLKLLNVEEVSLDDSLLSDWDHFQAFEPRTPNEFIQNAYDEAEPELLQLGDINDAQLNLLKTSWLNEIAVLQMTVEGVFKIMQKLNDAGVDCFEQAVECVIDEEKAEKLKKQAKRDLKRAAVKPLRTRAMKEREIAELKAKQDHELRARHGKDYDDRNAISYLIRRDERNVFLASQLEPLDQVKNDIKYGYNHIVEMCLIQAQGGR